MSHNVSQFLVRAETSHLTKTVPRLAVNANLALLVGLVMVSFYLELYHLAPRRIWEKRRNANTGHIDLLQSLALACSTLLQWLWIGVKEIILGLWVLTLLALALLDVWKSVSRFLDGVEGPGPASWFWVLGWVGVLAFWTLATYQSVEVLRTNLVLWGLTLLHHGIDVVRVRSR